MPKPDGVVVNEDFILDAVYDRLEKVGYKVEGTSGELVAQFTDSNGVLCYRKAELPIVVHFKNKEKV